MYWLTIPLIAVNLVIMCSMMALREKWRWSSFAILVIFLFGWMVLWNTILNDVEIGRH